MSKLATLLNDDTIDEDLNNRRLYAIRFQLFGVVAIATILTTMWFARGIVAASNATGWLPGVMILACALVFIGGLRAIEMRRSMTALGWLVLASVGAGALAQVAWTVGFNYLSMVTVAYSSTMISCALVFFKPHRSTSRVIVYYGATALLLIDANWLVGGLTMFDLIAAVVNSLLVLPAMLHMLQLPCRHTVVKCMVLPLVALPYYALRALVVILTPPRSAAR